jgi:outer membrane protein assembly factor BamD
MVRWTWLILIPGFAAVLACGGSTPKPSTHTTGDKKDSQTESEEPETSEDLDSFAKNTTPTPAGSRGAPTGRSTESSVTVKYEKTVEANWKRAEEEFKDENYVVAQKYYTYIKTKYPYLSYAVQSELRIGDCLFNRERYLEAIDAFQNFTRLHPTHKDVAYAMYKIGAAHFEQIPGDWFLVPPSFEKDQAPEREAERSLRAFVERFPNDPNTKDGQRLLGEVRKRMVAHERYVASFYKRLDKVRGWANRLEVIRTNYQDVGVDDALLAELVDAYALLKDQEKAQGVLREMETKFPSSPLLPAVRTKVSAIPKAEPKPS